MARRGQDLLNKLADRGEEAIGRVGELPGAGRAIDRVDSLRRRLDEMQRRLQRVDLIEQRVTALEARVEELSASKDTPKKTTSARADGTRRRSTEKPLRPTQGPQDKLPE